MLAIVTVLHTERAGSRSKSIKWVVYLFIHRQKALECFEAFVSVNLTGGEADSDLDGMLDTWEIARFGDLSAGGEDDNDGDGSTNAEEYNADTDPLDAGDFLQISLVNRSVNGVGITWPAKPGRNYSVYRNDDLTAGNWVLLQEGRTVDAPGDLTVTDASIDNPRTRFYQVRSQAPPLPE